VAEDLLAGLPLSPSELRRAARFFRDIDRRRFVARRRVLRELLALYAGVAAQDLEFDTRCVLCGDPNHGKPRVRGPRLASRLAFSSSSSADLALVAVAWGTELGVDVEALRHFSDLDGLAELSLSPAERAALGRLPEALRPAAFLAAWTQKEAYLKGIGRGLGRPLDSVPASVPGDRQASWPSASTSRCAGWALYSFSPETAAVACLAVRGDLSWSHVRLLTWQTRNFELPRGHEESTR